MPHFDDLARHHVVHVNPRLASRDDGLPSVGREPGLEDGGVLEDDALHLRILLAINLRGNAHTPLGPSVNFKARTNRVALAPDVEPNLEESEGPVVAAGEQKLPVGMEVDGVQTTRVFLRGFV
jgi:hypothetical protein